MYREVFTLCTLEIFADLTEHNGILQHTTPLCRKNFSYQLYPVTIKLFLKVINSREQPPNHPPCQRKPNTYTHTHTHTHTQTERASRCGGFPVAADQQ